MPTVLELQSISKNYGDYAAVQKLSLSLQEGEFFSLVGPSGCGKTTTLRLVAGFETPSSGAILLNGQDVAGLPPNRRNVSTVFQNYALFPHLDVEANVRFGLERGNGHTHGEIRQRVSEMLRLLGLEGKEKRMPGQLSGGERQRVALARSLVLRPSVLLLDEPLSALDPQLRKHVRAELKSLQQRLGVTFLFVTHDQEEALSLADRIGVMEGGRLQQVGESREVYRQPKTRFVAEFLGDVSWVRADCALRPEHVKVSCSPPLDGSEQLRATVGLAEYLGSRVRLQLRLEDGRWCRSEVAAQDGDLQIGQTVYLHWNEADELAGLT